MKNYFKFLSVAALAAAGLVGCSTSEVVPPNGEDPVTPVTPEAPTGEPTYATFTVYDSQATTRVGEFPEQPAGELTTGQINDIRILIFDATTNKLEKNVREAVHTVGGAPKSATVLVNSGTKKLLVIANAATGTGSIDERLNGLPIGLSWVAFTDTINQWDLAGNQSLTQAPTYAAPTLTALLNGVRSLIPGYAATPNFVFSNGLTDSKFLAANVDSAASANAAVEDATKNNFRIGVKRLVAKATVIFTGGDKHTLDQKGLLSDLQYTYRNINRGVKLFEALSGGVPERPLAAYYYAEEVYGGTLTPLSSNEPDNRPFLPYYWRSNTYNAVYGPITDGTTNSTPIEGNQSLLSASAKYTYLTENDLHSQKDGGRTHAVIRAKYAPQIYVTTPTPGYVSDSVLAGAPGFAGGQFSEALKNFGKIVKQPVEASGTFWRVITPYGAGGSSVVITDPITTGNPSGAATVANIPENTLYGDSLLAYKVWWAYTHANSLATFDLAQAVALSKSKIGADSVQKFVNGQSYYRVNIRQKYESTDEVNKFEFVKRNFAYQIGISSFSSLGSPSIEDLDKGPDRQETGPTYVTAEIYIIPWKDAVTTTAVVPYPDL